MVFSMFLFFCSFLNVSFSFFSQCFCSKTNKSFHPQFLIYNVSPCHSIIKLVERNRFDLLRLLLDINLRGLCLACILARSIFNSFHCRVFFLFEISFEIYKSLVVRNFRPIRQAQAVGMCLLWCVFPRTESEIWVVFQ